MTFDGHRTVVRIRNFDGSEWVTRYTYDASGRLLKTTSGKEGEPATEIIYSYDGQGKLLKMTDSRKPDNAVIFHYDEHGRKTKLQVSYPADYRPNVAVGGSPFQAADAPPNLPGGGSAMTIYDEHDRPIEVQVRDAQGEVVSRAVRTYDAHGRVAEEKQILDNPETIIPAEVRAKILAQSGASLKELRDRLTDLMGGQSGPYSTTFSYDPQGRVTQTHRRIFNHEEEIETTYNEHGDKATEITRGTQIVVKGPEQHSSGPPPYSEVRYSYQYDSHGNWTGEIASYRTGPSGTFESSTARRRTLTYY